MCREEMIRLLMQNFASMNYVKLSEIDDQEKKEVYQREFSRLASFTDLKLQNMVLINCF